MHLLILSTNFSHAYVAIQERKPYKCTIPGCARKFSYIQNMKVHVRMHTGEKSYVCSYEGFTKKFNNRSDHAKHSKTHVSTKVQIPRLQEILHPPKPYKKTLF